MNETQKYIRQYQAALPHLKEKVAAALLMLIVSAVTATSATFAWIALSTAPEVSNLETTVAANGNLEIALSDKDGLEPQKSEIGDGGKDIVAKNVTWGNLVNLSDVRYGLDRLVLRPAQLNTTGNLSTQPLKVATYGYDGRVNTYNPDLLYTSYDATANSNQGAFVVAKDKNGDFTTYYGVRAISTVKTGENTQGRTVHAQIIKQADDSWTNTRNKYFNIHHGENGAKTKATLNKLLDAYVAYTLDGVDNDVTAVIPDFYDMMRRFDDFIDTAGDTLCLIALAQQYPTLAEDSDYYTPDTLCEAVEGGTLNSLVNINGLEIYASNRKQIKSIVAQLKNYKDTGATVKWTNVHYIVDFMVDVDTVKIGGYTVPELQKIVANASSNLGTLLGLLDTYTEIYNGVLCDMENLILLEGDAQATDFQYGSKEKITLTVTNVPVLGTANVSTTVDIVATKPYHIQTAYKDISSGDKTFIGKDAIAQDTYGLAIDFWLRTNANDAYVILEGNPVITKVEQEVEGSEDPVLVDAVTGYEGENRVWTDSVIPNGTTQGTGSYIFYADTPEMQTRGLEILSAMKVAFIDESGTILANADMDTAHAFQETGKVTVPVVLNNRSTPVLDEDGNHIKDENGNYMYAVTQMTPNIAKRITAIVYMDGESLYNENALTDEGMQGQLNIQFGIDKEMNPMDDTELELQSVNLSASADRTEFDFDTDTDFTTKITAVVNGIEPTTVTANFVRRINASQGSREDVMTFTKTGNTTWEAVMEFTAPGDYILRSIFIDGVEYELNTPVEITVSGYGIRTLTCDKILSGNTAEYMTADKYIDVSYGLTMGSTDKLPAKMQGVIRDAEGNYIYVNLVSNTNTYTGTVRISRSGTYTFTDYIIDGKWYEVPAAQQKTLKLNLGMTARVTLSETEFVLKDNPETEDVNEAKPTVIVGVHVLNDKDEIMKLPVTEGQVVELKYKHRTNSAVMLDADLTWNSVTNRYEGMINIGRAGFYDFFEVSAGSNKIQKATYAPVIIARSPTEPKFTGFAVESYQFAPNSTEGKVSVMISDSSTLNEAAIVDGEQIGDVKVTLKYLGENNNSADRLYGTEYTVYGRMGAGYTDATGKDITEWVFNIPAIDSDNNKDTPDSQHGWWELEESSMSFLAYTERGEEYEKVVDYIIDDVKLSDKDNVTQVSVDVKKNVKVSVTDFTGNMDNKFSGNQMMVPYAVEDLEVTITDTQGNAINGISGVKVFTRYTAADDAFVLEGDITSIPHSGFGGAAVPTATALAVADDPATEDINENLMKFRVNKKENTAYAPLEVLYAGTYKAAGVQFTINGITYTGYFPFYKAESECTDNEFILDSAEISYDVNWVKPTLEIDSVSPAPNEKFQTGTTGGCDPEPTYSTNSIADNKKSATLYYAYLDSGVLADGVPSKVAFRLYNGGNYSSAVVSSSSSSLSNTATISSVSGVSALTNMGTQGNMSSRTTGTFQFVRVKIYDAAGIGYTVVLSDAEGVSVTLTKG